MTFICTAKSKVGLPCHSSATPFSVFMFHVCLFIYYTRFRVVTGKLICSTCCARISHSSQRTRSCGHVRATASSPTAPWTSTASLQSATFGPKTPGCTCAPAPTCSPWTRAPPSSMSQVRDWPRPLNHRSLTSSRCHLSVYPPAPNCCMFLLLSSPCMLFFVLFCFKPGYPFCFFSYATRLSVQQHGLFFHLSNSTQFHQETTLGFPALVQSACLLTNQIASASSYCLYARNQYSL